ncbi:MAG: nucleotidyltransferase domain-containing protein [Acidimicrobiia bacterium]|nr:nucleotidyltransferase domain-containing protein [Acidimicrobiia bacterium]
MNLRHPLTSLIPSLAGRVLEVLAGTTKPLSGREVMRLAHRRVSQQGVQNALDELAAHGLVTQVTAGNAVLNTLNREHILAPFVLQIVDLRRQLLDAMGAIIVEEAPTVRQAILFGSLATNSANEESDIDIVLVWSDDASSREREQDIAPRINRLTGNECNLLHYTTSEFERLAETSPSLFASIEAERIDLVATDNT